MLYSDNRYHDSRHYYNFCSHQFYQDSRPQHSPDCSWWKWWSGDEHNWLITLPSLPSLNLSSSKGGLTSLQGTSVVSKPILQWFWWMHCQLLVYSHSRRLSRADYSKLLSYTFSICTDCLFSLYLNEIVVCTSHNSLIIYSEKTRRVHPVFLGSSLK